MYNYAMEEDQLLIAEPWTQFADEPDIWYDKFIQYYVPLGLARSLVGAFKAFAMETDAEQAIIMTLRPPTTAPHSWSVAAREWDWRKRAYAWDAQQNQELANVLQQARHELQAATLDATRTLVTELKGGKNRIAAAKEILDRGGIPSVSVTVQKTVPFTADDLAVAQEELNKWLEKKLPPQLTTNSQDESG